MLNYYKSLQTLPIFNFFEVVGKSIPDLRYLQIFDINEEPPAITKKDELILSEVWQNMLYSMKDLDVSTFESYINMLKEAINFKIQLHKRNIRKLNDKRFEVERPERNIKYAPLLATFNTYLENLDLSFTNFEVLAFKPIENITLKIKELLSLADDEINELSKIKEFYTYDEYIFFVINNCPKNIAILSQPEFINTFFISETIKLPSIKDFETYLQGEYRKMNKLDEYFIFRVNFFDFNKMKYEPILKGKEDYYNDIISLEYVTKSNLNIKTDSVAKLIAVRQVAKEIIKNNSKNGVSSLI